MRILSSRTSTGQISDTMYFKTDEMGPERGEEGIRSRWMNERIVYYGVWYIADT